MCTIRMVTSTNTTVATAEKIQKKELKNWKKQIKVLHEKI